MLIEKPGQYITHGGYFADVYEIRGAYCIGWITLKNGGRKTGLWQAEHGTIMGGSPEDDLEEYIGPFGEPTIQ
jgi:hypothetical protein